MKKLTISVIVLLLMVTLVMGATFNSKIEAENYRTDILANKQYAYKIIDSEIDLNSNKETINWEINIWKNVQKSKQVCDEFAVCVTEEYIDKEAILYERFNHKFEIGLSNVEINLKIQIIAQRFIDNWEPVVKYEIDRSAILDKEIMLTKTLIKI